MLNSNTQTKTIVGLVTPSGGTEVEITSADDLLAYYTDADAFAAKHFGVTKEQYVAWIETNGHPLCASRTKRGTLCQNMLTGEHDPKRHACLHRLVYCASHAPK